MDQGFDYMEFIRGMTMSELWLLLSSAGLTVPLTTEQASVLCFQLIRNDNRPFKLNVKAVYESRNGNALCALYHQPSHVTKEWIQKMFAGNEEVQADHDSIKVSLDCPVGKMRLAWPCRSTKCQHIQCFDASLVLSMHRGKSGFNCPVCDMFVRINDLRIDLYFLEVVQKLQSDPGSFIELNSDGTWSKAAAVTSNKEVVDLASPINKRKQIVEVPELIILSDDEENDNEEVQIPMENNVPSNTSAGNKSKMDI